MINWPPTFRPSQQNLAVTPPADYGCKVRYPVKTDSCF